MKILLLNTLMCASFVALATVQISNLQVHQRYPWNGKVDITFDVSCATNDAGFLSFRANDPSHQRSILMPSFTLDGVDHRSLFGFPNGEHVKWLVPQLNGSHRIVWDSTDYNDAGNTSLSYEISIQRAKQNAPDAIGTPNGIIGNVVVLDLAALIQDRLTVGTIEFYPSVDLGTFNCDLYKTSKMALIRIPAGTHVTQFSNTPVRSVSLSTDYWIGMHQVTRAQYTTVMGIDPSDTSVSEGTLAPVNKVSWTTINQENGFLMKVNEKLQLAGGLLQIQLPTEAQWEIAARAGTTTKWFFGTTDTLLSDYAWFADNSLGINHTVGLKKPNPWGLYDVYGNVWEWCMDEHQYKFPNSEMDPIFLKPETGKMRVDRGGAYTKDSSFCNSVYRDQSTWTQPYPNAGFRVVLVPGSF